MALGITVLLVAGTAAGWAYVRSQYYVGDDDGRVAVFRGVDGSLAGLRFHTVESESALPVDGLDEITRSRVLETIPAADRAAALDILDRVRESYCSGVPLPSSAAPTGSPLAAPSAEPTTPGPAATASAGPSPTTTPTAPAVPVVPSTPPTPKPGCP